MITVFDIGGSRLKAARSDQAGQVAPLGAVDTPGADLVAFRQAIAGFLDPATRAIALSVAGCVDPATDRMRCANIPCIDGLALAPALAAALGLPVTIVNDADAFALAEAASGAGQGHRVVFGIILGTGVGGGVVIGGRALTGPGGFAGEWGHGPVANLRPRGHDLPAFACGCGQAGCLDTLGGARGMERLHDALTGQPIGAREIEARWLAGNAAATETVAVWADLISGPLAMMINTLGATIVPVGGGLGKSAALVAELDRWVRDRTLHRFSAPLLVQARHRIEPGLIGASLAGWQAHG
jgi:N-acetylglucosamine kinase